MNPKIVIKMRKNNSLIITILKKYITYNPSLDELVCLRDILRILDKGNFAVSKKEILTGFNKYFKKEFHSTKKEYLSSIYSDFNIKRGTITKPSKYRAVVSKKRAVVVTTEGLGGGRRQDFKGINTNPHNFNKSSLGLIKRYENNIKIEGINKWLM